MIGSELAPHPTYLLDRAANELAIRPRLSRRQTFLAEAFVRVFGVPEIGVQLRILRVLRALPHDVGRLADLGCGAGMLLGAVARSRRHDGLVGFEVDARSADVAARTHPAAQIVVTRLEDADASYDGTFRHAACVDVLEHVRDDEVVPFLRRAHALLAPGGRLVVHVPKIGQRRHFKRFAAWGHHDHEREGFAPAELASALSAAGFDIVSIDETFGPVASWCWEINMIAAGTPWQALVFPPALAIAWIADRFTSCGNGLACVARRA